MIKNLATTNADFEVLILAPTGGDAAIAKDVLIDGGFNAQTYENIEALCTRLKKASGALVISEEAVMPEDAAELKSILNAQEAWSNLPIILMTSQVEKIFSTEKIFDIFGTNGSVSLLERPFRVITFLSSVRVALKTRERQYQVRDLLKAQTTAVQQRDEFLSIASHELKTPITSLKLQVQMRQRLIRKGDPSVFSPNKVTALIDKTETQLDRLTRLVDDMLDISRIVNGKLSLNLEPVNLGLLAKEVYDNFSYEFEFAQCNVQLKIADHIEIMADRYRIEQVIANLYSNAIKYGKGHPVWISVEQAGSNAIFKVQDHGMGIPPESLERIFMRFERANTGSGISGLGLGLYITRQILDMHRGKIGVQSKVNEGSTFQVDIPIANAV